MAVSAVSATTATETNYPVLINGYLCYSAAEVRAARESINPRSLNDVTGAASSARATRSSSTSPSPALTTYNALGSQSEEESSRRRGQAVDILA